MTTRCNSSVLAAMTLLVLHAAPAAALEPREVFKTVDPNIVVVRARLPDGEMQGSGVLIEPLDLVTSCHVIGESSKIMVAQGSVQRSARVRFRDRARDLCMLRLEDGFPEGRAAVLLPPGTGLDIGQRVFAIGAPRGLERTLTVGIVSGLREMEKSSAPLIQTDASVSPGSSGGGLFDEEARLVGLITFQFRDSQNLNFAIPSAWIRDLPARSRDLMADSAPSAAQPVQPGAESTQSGAVLRRGDWWTYRVSLKQRTVGNLTVAVASVNDVRVTERFTLDSVRSFSTERTVDSTFSAERFQAPIVLPGGYQLVELSPYFPADTRIKAGQVWKEVPGEFVIYPIGKRWLASEVRVEAQEKVRVPAGEFNAWRIESISAPTYYNGNSIRIKCTFWYSAAAGKVVKLVMTTESGYSVVQGTETYELTAFERGGG
jgi:serine protease Do